MKIFLIGLMGSGKSFWADKLSRSLNIPSFHLDDEIEKAEGKAISEIFTEKGESYFRSKESKVLKSFTNKNNFILSTGGGTPCFNDNMEWMNKNGITIWIDPSIKILAQRLITEKLHRPLIASIKDYQLENFLIEMREKRKAFYSKAQYQLTGDITEKDFFKIILPYE